MRYQNDTLCNGVNDMKKQFSTIEGILLSFNEINKNHHENICAILVFPSHQHWPLYIYSRYIHEYCWPVSCWKNFGFEIDHLKNHSIPVRKGAVSILKDSCKVAPLVARPEAWYLIFSFHFEYTKRDRLIRGVVWKLNNSFDSPLVKYRWEL